tara:strand:- start:487 stop:660 length:174 start_codon:yes stop_codon:yes gene_type:complete
MFFQRWKFIVSRAELTYLELQAQVDFRQLEELRIDATVLDAQVLKDMKAHLPDCVVR